MATIVLFTSSPIYLESVSPVFPSLLLLLLLLIFTVGVLGGPDLLSGCQDHTDSTTIHQAASKLNHGLVSPIGGSDGRENGWSLGKGGTMLA